MESPLLTVKETAEYLNVDEYIIYCWVRAKEFPSLRVGTRWRIYKAKLDDWVLRRAEVASGSYNRTVVLKGQTYFI
jgi:excisionase family DNA binding protein